MLKRILHDIFIYLVGAFLFVFGFPVTLISDWLFDTKWFDTFVVYYFIYLIFGFFITVGLMFVAAFIDAIIMKE